MGRKVQIIKILAGLDLVSNIWVQITFVLGSFLLAALVLIGTTDVVATAFFNMPLKGAIEVSCGCLVAAAFLGLPTAQRVSAHIICDVLFSRFPDKLKAVCFTFALICSFLFFAYLSSCIWIVMSESWAIKELGDNVGFPIYPFKILAFLGVTGATWEAGRQLLDNIIRSFRSDQMIRS